MPDEYAVVGNPVAHSRSPQIHAEFARQTGQNLIYGKLLAPVDGFAETVAAFRARGGRGLNVTLPFKGEAFAYARRLSDRARAAGAVNTLKFEEGSVFGDNTDGVGLANDLVRNLGREFSGQRILLLGAGGAARGVIGTLLERNPATLVVVNRTLARARELAVYFDRGLEVAEYPSLGGRTFDLVINATSASLGGSMPQLPEGVFARGSLAYDMMYGKEETPFLQFARCEGAATLADGLGMLVEQAAESFYVWRGVRPDTAPVLKMLRASAQ